MQLLWEYTAKSEQLQPTSHKKNEKVTINSHYWTVRTGQSERDGYASSNSVSDYLFFPQKPESEPFSTSGTF